MVSTLVVGTNTYVTQAEATTYLDDSARASAWQFVGSDDKDRALLTALREIDKQIFEGAKTVSTQELEFPRTGLTDKDGNSVASDSVPEVVKNAQMELAYEISQSSSLEGSTGTADNNKRIKAGSVEVERFRPVSGTRFPQIVQEYLRAFLRGVGSVSYPTASGTSIASEFDTSDGYDTVNGWS